MHCMLRSVDIAPATPTRSANSPPCRQVLADSASWAEFFYKIWDREKLMCPLRQGRCRRDQALRRLRGGRRAQGALPLRPCLG